MYFQANFETTTEIYAVCFSWRNICSACPEKSGGVAGGGGHKGWAGSRTVDRRKLSPEAETVQIPRQESWDILRA